jgi:hypothetical protein
MTEPSESEPVPLGIDLGSATTVGAVVDGNEPRLLDADGTTAVPTRLGVADTGFVVGDDAGDDAQVPLPYLDDGRPSSPGDVPLALFLELLRRRWQGDDTPDDDAATAERAAGSETAGTDDVSPETDGADGDEPFSAVDVAPDEASAAEGAADRSEEAATADAGSGEAIGRFGPTTVAVPGAYSAADCARVEEAATAAGFDAVEAVRAPVAVAAAEALDADGERTLAVADVGERWASFALVTVGEAGDLSVEARTTLTGHGRRDFDRALARWVLGRVEADHGVSLECTDEAMARLREAVHDAADDVGPDGETTATVDLHLAEGVEVTDGGLLGAESIHVEVDLDLEACIEALDGLLRDLQASVDDLRDAGPEDVDALVLAGGGAELAPVLVAVENAFGRRSRPPARGDGYTAAAIGAAALSERRASGRPTVARETLDTDVVLRGLGESGVEARRLTGPGDGPEDVATGRLVPTSAHQLSGVFQVGRRHRITGELERLSTFACSNLPSGDDAPAVVVSVDPSADDHGVTVDLDGDVDRSHAPVVDPVEESSLPWLAHADAETTDLGDADRSDGAAFDRRTDEERALAAIDETGVARVAWKFRNRLRNQLLREDAELSTEDLEPYLREFDKNLRIEGVELFEPAVGEPVDAERHWVVRAEEAPDHEERTILDVLALGIAVDGEVVEPAEVVAAKG